MASIRVPDVRIAGVASAVPAGRHSTSEKAEFPAADVERIAKSTGIRARHIAPAGVCTSDLCQAAATALLKDLGWKAAEFDALVFVSQTPDFILPATSCLLHAALGLPSRAAAFDINLGSSGYPYALWLGASILRAGMRKVLLLVGDTSTKLISSQDRSLALLFGDAGTATALEATPGRPDMFFDMETNGAGAEHLIVPAGGFRHPHSDQTRVIERRKSGSSSEEQLHMDGGEIFALALRHVPPLVKSLLGASQWTMEDVDGVVLHQANRFMLEHLGKSLRIPPSKLVIALEDFGNTSSASIPLAMTASLGSRLRQSVQRLLLCGFGPGFSLAGAAVSAGPIAMPELIEYTA